MWVTPNYRECGAEYITGSSAMFVYLSSCVDLLLSCVKTTPGGATPVYALMEPNILTAS